MSASVVSNLKTHKPTQLALDIVKKIIAKKGPIETQALYALTQKVHITPAQLKQNALEQPDVPSGPGSRGKADIAHPVRSITYLKRNIMPALVELREVEKVHVKQRMRPTSTASSPNPSSPSDSSSPKAQAIEVSSWPWQLKRLTLPKPKAVFAPASMAAALGQGADWGHLNRRRRAGREEKIARDLRWAKELDKIRRQVGVEKAESAYRLQLRKGAERKAEAAKVVEVPLVEKTEGGEQVIAP